MNHPTGPDGRFLPLDVCPKGHPRTDDNIYTEPGSGKRKCRACRAARNNRARTPTEETWRAMRARCHDPKNDSYRYYGGRGIEVCERWERFDQFLVDMGERPKARTLDRINVDGPYEPGNCRWATASEQIANRRSSGSSEIRQERQEVKS